MVALLARNGEETSRSAKETRKELSSSLKSVSERLSVAIAGFMGLVENKAVCKLSYKDGGGTLSHFGFLGGCHEEIRCRAVLFGGVVCVHRMD